MFATRKSAALVGGALAAAMIGGAVVGASPAAAAGTAKPSLSIKTNHTTYVVGQRATITAHLGTTATNRKLSLYITPVGKRAFLIGQDNANSKGNVTVSGTIGYNSTFTVTFGGDAKYAAARATVRVKVRAKLFTAIRGYYKTKGHYRLIHAKKRGTFAAAVAPNKTGKHVHFPLQVLKHGKWHGVVNHSFKLNKKSAVAISFSGSKGHHYRIRAVYTGDRANSAANSGWTYAEFV